MIEFSDIIREAKTRILYPLNTIQQLLAETRYVNSVPVIKIRQVIVINEVFTEQKKCDEEDKEDERWAYAA